MVHLVNFFLFWHPAIRAVQCHCYFGFQTPLPLFLPLRRYCHSNSSVSKLKRYSKKWNVVFATTFGTIHYPLSHDLRNVTTTCSINGRFWDASVLLSGYYIAG